MSDLKNHDALKAAINRMCDGDFRSFIEARRLMDDIDFIASYKTLEKESLFALYTGKNFVEQVVSNIAADSMFEFPPEGTSLDRLFRDITISAGLFFRELLMRPTIHYEVAIDHFMKAINSYYKYLDALSSRGRTSDLGGEDHIWRYENIGTNE